MIAARTNVVYEFGPFRLEPSEHRLVREGRSIPLSGKAFDTLRVLLERPGTLVLKQELFFHGVVCYLMFLGTFLSAVGFLGNYAVPKSIDSGPQLPLGHALAVNFTLLGLFALQHSVMARPWFKRAWTRMIPTPIERSTYVLFSSLALLLLFWKWQPMGGVIWNVESAYGRLVLKGLYVFGWLTVLITTFLINHFDLFGLRQVWLHLRGREYTPIAFRIPGPYRIVRHPLYVGWLLVFWSAPVMTSAHLVFAIVTTAYILVAIQFEERDLIRFRGEYAEYRRRVPMILPLGSPRRRQRAEVSNKAVTGMP